jgi:hypothetical protein
MVYGLITIIGVACLKFLKNTKKRTRVYSSERCSLGRLPCVVAKAAVRRRKTMAASKGANHVTNSKIVF